MGSGEGDDYRAWHEYFSWLFSLATGHNKGDLPRFIDQVYTPREDLPADLPKAGPQSSKTYAFYARSALDLAVWDIDTDRQPRIDSWLRSYFGK